MEPGQPKRKLSDHYFEWTQTIFVDSRDRVFVPDIGIENGTVWMIDSNGVATKLASDLITKLNRPKDKHNDVLLGIGRDGTGNTYVCETAGKKVKKIKPDGTVLDWYQSEDAWCPTGITWFRGNMYILEYKLDGKMEGPRISRLTTGADRSTVFSFEEENQEASPIEEGGEDKNHLWIVLLFLPVLLALYLGSRMLRK